MQLKVLLWHFQITSFQYWFQNISFQSMTKKVSGKNNILAHMHSTTEFTLYKELQLWHLLTFLYLILILLQHLHF